MKKSKPFDWILLVIVLVFLMNKGTTAIRTIRKDLYFQLVVSQSERFDFSGYIPAVDVALRLINSNASILSDYELKYTDIIDAKCRDTPAVHGFIDHVTNPVRNETEVIIIGADCSVSSQPIASLAHLWNLVQISPVSTSPRLSDDKAYPTFLRITAPDTSVAVGIVKLMKALEWKYIAIITQEEDIFTYTRDNLTARVKQNNLYTVSSVGFPTNENPQSALENLKTSGGRVIFMNVYPAYAVEIMCQAIQLGMTLPDYAWISYGWYFHEFWKTPFENRSSYDSFNNCTHSDLKRIVDRMIVIDHYSRQDDGDSEIIIGGLTKESYEEEYRQQWNLTFEKLNDSRNHPDQLLDSTLAYDATWLAALALHKTNEELQMKELNLSLDNYTHKSTHIRDIVYKHALTTIFNGASGRVKLFSNGDREPELRFYQYRAGAETITLKRPLVGFMDSKQQLIIYEESKPLYQDGTPRSHIHETIHVALFITYTVLSIAGVVFAIVCLVFNWFFRNKMIVKLSSPFLNIIFIAGIITIYILVILFGIDDGLVDVSVMSGFCQANVWIAVIAFTLVYGVVLAKTFRVFYIFKNLQVTNVAQKKIIQDWHMVVVIGVLLMIDAVFLTIVTAVPEAILTAELTRDTKTLEKIPSEVHVCTSESSHIWIPILAVYKAVELVFSLIFAFETRKVKVKELNDSRMIIFSVYTIVATAIAVAPVLAFLAEAVTIKYAIAGIICLASSTLLLGMNFIPKMHFLYRNPSGEIKMNFDGITTNLTKDKKAKKISASKAQSQIDELTSVNVNKAIEHPPESGELG